MHLGGATGPHDARHAARSLFDHHLRALAAIATLTAVWAESTGGIPRTVVYFGSPFSTTTKRSSALPLDALQCQTYRQCRSHATSPRNKSITGASFRLPFVACRSARSRCNHFYEIATCPDSVCNACGHCCCASNRECGRWLHRTYGRGAGVGRSRGAGVNLVAVAVAVGVAVGVGDTVGVGVGPPPGVTRTK